MTTPAALPASPRRPAVVCEEVVIRYGDTVAVDRLSFTGQAGQVVALLGPNGAGKTSTVEALEGYRRATAARSGSSASTRPGTTPRLVPRIGVMLQRGGVYPMLGSAQVLHLFSRYYDDPEDPDELIDLVGLGRSAGPRGGGCRAASNSGSPWPWPWWASPRCSSSTSPPPASTPRAGSPSARSSPTQRDRGICVILTTHELDEAERLADQVVIIDQGRMLAEGIPAALASGAADGSIRFTTDAGIDTAALVLALGRRNHASTRNGPAPTGSGPPTAPPPRR